MKTLARAILDTSVLIAIELGRDLKSERLPEEGAISVITFAELRAGVLHAKNNDARGRRLATLDAVSHIELLSIDQHVAAAWAQLRVGLVEAGKRVNVNDLWIAATALANGIPVVTQDADYDPLNSIAGMIVVRV